MNADWEPGGKLLEAWSHLRCAIVVAIASDSRIVMDQVEAAFALMEAERQKAIKEDEMPQFEDQWCGDRPGEEGTNVVER